MIVYFSNRWVWLWLFCNLNLLWIHLLIALVANWPWFEKEDGYDSFDLQSYSITHWFTSSRGGQIKLHLQELKNQMQWKLKQFLKLGGGIVIKESWTGNRPASQPEITVRKGWLSSKSQRLMALRQFSESEMGSVRSPTVLTGQCVAL